MLGVGGPLRCRGWAILSIRGLTTEFEVSSVKSSLRVLPLLSEKLMGHPWPAMVASGAKPSREYDYDPRYVGRVERNKCRRVWFNANRARCRATCVSDSRKSAGRGWVEGLKSTGLGKLGPHLNGPRATLRRDWSWWGAQKLSRITASHRRDHLSNRGRIFHGQY